MLSFVYQIPSIVVWSVLGLLIASAGAGMAVTLFRADKPYEPPRSKPELAPALAQTKADYSNVTQRLVCSHCGARNPGNAHFCSVCGAIFMKETPEPDMSGSRAGYANW